MGTYNADKFPDIARATVLARNYNFIPDEQLLTDQWTIDPTNRVSSFLDGTGNIKCKIKTNPNDVPLT